MGTPYFQLAALVQRLRTSLPVRFTLTDPFTGGQIEIVRENMLVDFIVDTPNLGSESQICPAHYVEFARLHRAAEYSAELAATEYTAWKAERANEYRAANPGVAPKARGKAAAAEDDGEQKQGKGPTGAQVEAYYRSHADYKKVSEHEKMLRAWAGLFEDAKKGIEMKARIIDGQNRSVRGFEGVERAVAPTEERVFEVPPNPPPGPMVAPPQSPYQVGPGYAAPNQNGPYAPYPGAAPGTPGGLPPMPPPFPGSR